ncbi:FAD-binding oxidoreductase [Amycolatopsis sp. NPDC051903]|uniref:FAD-binding oxidoreductase n=1 Tax=Amycolatopsis sp. NPDC051903 TaxID=3363936 RepID=UPI0037B5A4A0
MSEKFFEAVRQALGAEAVDTSAEAVARFGFNRLPGGDRVPAGVVWPGSAADVRAVVRLAGQHGVAVWPASTGHNLGLGEYSPVRDAQVVLDLGRRMNRVLEVNETLGYAVVEPGVTFRQLRAELAARGDALMLSGTSGPPDGGVLGNALDRGAGYTPYFDHFGMLSGLEVVLPDGELFHTGDGTLAGAKTRYVNKSGFGPMLEGLFSQSNYGIVTSAAIWLMPRPPVVRAWGFTFPDDADLPAIIEIVRGLKLANAVPTLIKVTSGAYGFATEATHPRYEPGAGALSDAERRRLQDEYGTGAWTVTGAFYGPTGDAVEPMIRRVRDVFEATGKATYLSHDEIAASPVFRIHLDTFSGEPTEAELGLLDWRPGGGATWFLPATPMIGEIAQQHQELSRRILTEHGFEYFAEFVCGPRAARALHLVIYNRADEAERQRMNDCYAALVEAYDRIGCPIGRTPTDWQERAMDRLPSLRKLAGALKGALDPQGVLAPGKYGIS